MLIDHQFTPEAPPIMSRPLAPIAELQSHTSTYHGVTLDDPYNWMRDEKWQEVMTNPEVLNSDIRAYLEAENEYAEAILADTKPIQQELFEELKGRIKQDDSSVPQPDGDWSYYVSYVQDGEQPLYCRKNNSTNEEQILLDGNKLSEGKSYFQFGGISHSNDHKYVAWSVDEKGSEQYTIYVRDIAAGKELDQSIESTAGNVCWDNTSSVLYYVRRDENMRPALVFRHDFAHPEIEDELVYQERDPAFVIHIGNVQSKKFLAINASGHQTSEWHLIDANDPKAQPKLVSPRKFGHEYSIEEHHGKLYIISNYGDAEDFKMLTASLDQPDPETWQELIPHKPGRLLINHTLFENYMAYLERENGLPRIVIRDLTTAEEHAIAFDEEAYSLGLSSGYEFDTNQIRFTYSSMTTPAQVYDYNMKTRERSLRKTQEIPSGHEISDYVTRRVFAPSHDGEEIPVTLLYHKDTPLDGSAPLFQYGYGSYGHTMPACFYVNELSLVKRGFIYAIAHIRGGKEKGYRWYRLGKMEHKINTFKDFISVSEYLIEQNYTTKGRIVAHGGSAGGMLMGAVVNMRPDLFAGIIAEVPFVDVLNTMLDGSLPLTPPEWTEWGNPIESKEEFERIRSYSPYDNVSEQDYPAMLVMAGLTDPRVTYWEPAKWVAKLRNLKTDNNILALKTHMEAGHGGSSGRFEYLKEVAVVQSFALKMTKLI